MSQEKTFDLVAIQGAEVFLGSENVSSGNYTQIRLDVAKVIVTLDSKDITAKLPSDKLKVVRPWEVEAGQKTIPRSTIKNSSTKPVGAYRKGRL